MVILTDKLFFVAKCVLINSKNKFLILKRTDYKKDGTGGLWDIPGGSVDSEEDVNNAMKRELSEELGITTSQYLQIFAIDSGKGTPSGYFIFSLFYLRDFNDEITLSSEHSEYRWISANEIDKYKYYLAPSRISSIKKLLDTF